MFLPLALYLFLLVAVLALCSKRLRASEVFLLFITGLAALRSARHIPIFALITARMFAQQVWDPRLAASLDCSTRVRTQDGGAICFAPSVGAGRSGLCSHKTLRHESVRVRGNELSASGGEFSRVEETAWSDL